MLVEQSYVSCLLGALVPILLFWPCFSIRAMGAGDIKLLSVLGLFQGITWMPAFLVKALFLGAGLAMIQIIRYRNLRTRLRYLFHYIKMSYMTGRYTRYYDASVDGRSMTIHFSVAIFGAFVWDMISHV